MKILAVVLLLIPLSDCWVVDDFTESCPQFFYTVGNVVFSPTRFPGERYKQICQKTQNRDPFFATFYDTENRIPVYSAYSFARNRENRKNITRKDDWLIEPQLDDQNAPDYMSRESSVEKGKRGSKQALKVDYEYSGFDKGHLFPVFCAPNQDCADATFTLTNAAPQHKSFNRGKWRKTEEIMTKLLNEACSQMDVYVVTGVVPGNKYLSTNSQVYKDRVRIPSDFWAAYRCVDQNGQVRYSGGFLGTNEDNKDNSVFRVSVRILENGLTRMYGKPFTLFNERSAKSKR